MSVVKNTSKRTKFRLKSIQTFCSDEWMAGAKKKYRTVFDRAELQYVRCEVALHNLEFGGEAWSMNITLKCFETTNGLHREVCSLGNEVVVDAETDVVYVRDGWGAEETGAFWKKGNYSWEIYIDDEKIGEAAFFVNDIGRVRRSGNPYFAVQGIAFYPGDYDGWKQEHRTLLETFARQQTQYVWAEVTLRNKTDREWNYEFFFNFYDAARQLKGQVIRTGVVEHDRRDYNYTFDAGWGNNTPGSWKSDQYYFDVVFMDQLIASGSFYVGEKESKGVPALTHLID